MSAKRNKQADKLAAAFGQSQSVPRPSNVTVPEDVKPELRKAITAEPQPKGKQVTVGAKVDEAIAYHWAVQAKIHKRPMSQVITKALAEAFGLPEGHSLNGDD